MKLRLTTKFMRGIVSKLLAKFIFKKTGYKVNIQLNDFDLSFVDGETTINANVELNLDNKEFTKIIKDIGLD
jgi:hypothetical protein